MLIKKNMKLTACMYIRVMISYIRCAAFEKSIQIYCTLTILIICRRKKEKKLNINIASILITFNRN